MACRTASRNFPGVMRLSKRCCLPRQHSLRYSFGFLLVDVGEGLLLEAEFIARCRLIALASSVSATRLLISSSVAVFEPGGVGVLLFIVCVLDLFRHSSIFNHAQNQLAAFPPEFASPRPDEVRAFPVACVFDGPYFGRGGRLRTNTLCGGLPCPM